MTTRITSRSVRTIAVVLMLMVGAGALWATGGSAQSIPGEGTGGPILVVTDLGDLFGRYDAEILRAEGLNEFAVTDKVNLNATTLASYQVVVLAHTTSLSGAQVTALTDWVQAGGNLIAMRPDEQLAGLLGLADAGGTLDNGYIKVDTSSAPGAQITGETMQFHGTADRYTLNGASSIAALYSNATSATSNPAVTLRSVGTHGGQAAAFTYDLARSVVYTRQGNPAWAGQERDGDPDRVIRSDDLFFGAKAGDIQPDWVNLDKVRIPQADEQQRLLANLITQMNLDRTPLPRFWYLPRGEKAAVVMSGDDHGHGGTIGQFDKFIAASPQGCSIGNWECIRSTSYVYSSTPIDQAKAQDYQAKGFEIALHLTTNCADYTPASLQNNWAEQLPEFTATWPGLNPMRTNRTHCIAWSDWVGEPRAELAHGVRLDLNYYYWPGTWVRNRPGMFTGSGFPMRFADTDGSLIDVYQAATQLTDESDINIPTHIAALLDGALGADGYYGVFTANMHTDEPDHAGADAIVAAATARHVPVISAKQLLDWVDGRDGSSFQNLSFAGGVLRFTVDHAGGANGLQAMLPASAATGALTQLTRNGTPVTVTTRTVKGIDYKVFDAPSGDYVASYGDAGSTPPGTTTGGTTAPGNQNSSSNQGSSHSGATTSGGSGTATTSRKAPRVTVSKRTVRASRSGVVTVRVSCPRSALHCQVKLSIRRGGRQLAQKLVTVGGGKTAKVKLQLTRAARKQLARSGSLTVNVVATTAGTERNHATTKTRIRVLAPGTR